MPEGVETYVDGGFATIDFVDPRLRGAALAKLLDIGGPQSIEVITRDGPRRKYRVPEGNAEEAGLVDTASSVDATASGDAGHAEALASADAATPGNPGLAATSRGANETDPVAQADVLGNQSVLSTVSNSGVTPAGKVVPHAALVDRLRRSDLDFNQAIAKRTAELAAQRGDVISAGVINASLATMPGALSTDPQSRGGDGLVPADEQPAEQPAPEQPESPAPAPEVNPAAEAPSAPSPSGPEPLDPASDVSLTAEGSPAVEPPAASEAAPDQAQQPQPQDQPTLDWTRAQIDAHAAEVHGIDTTGAPNKKAALDQIPTTE